MPQVIGEYNHPRRPLICFTLDGDYDLNPTMKEIAESHGYPLTFAVRYTSFNDNAMGVVRLYKTWESDGHEIAIHTNDDISNLTDSEVEQVFKTAFARGMKYGFNVNGVVARAGEWRNNILEVAKQRVYYFASQPNHAGSDPQVYHTFPGDPYMLWRYSMQTATLDQQKSAVEACIANKGLLMFYGHARTGDELLNFTPENFDALLTYIDGYTETYDVSVKTTYEAVKDFYGIRYEDITNLLT